MVEVLRLASACDELQREQDAAHAPSQQRLCVEARDLQRNGDILGFAQRTARAEELAKKIDAMKAAAAVKT